MTNDQQTHLSTQRAVKTWTVQWRFTSIDDWEDVTFEEFLRHEHAESRLTAYWQKMSFARWMEFRVKEVE